MHIIVIYDITDDGLRGKISERLKDYGLERIQFSAFQGEMTRHGLNSLTVDMKKFLNDGEETDSIVIFQLCASCFDGRIVLGAKKEMEKDEVRLSFF